MVTILIPDRAEHVEPQLPEDGVAETLRRLIDGGAVPPFVYCYPVRSSYRPLPAGVTVQRVWDLEASRTSDLNLYLHVPFCRYKCGFCNLYTVISEDVDVHDAYTAALCTEIRNHADIIQSRRLRTVYIGGGTPSLLRPQHFTAIFAALDDVYPNWRAGVEEVAIEASPDSVVASPQTVEHLLDLGLTRANVGIQSLVPAELREAGRSQAGEQTVRHAIEYLKNSRLSNLSTDLIMGFQGQTDESWRRSVDELLQYRPDTISTYFLTVRPDAWFSKLARYNYMREPALYDRYDYARERMRALGMVQESNVRHKVMGSGGYRQKVLQFRGVPVLGLGVAARTYTNTVDYINGGSSEPSLQQVRAYIEAPPNASTTPTAGFTYNDEERIRKRFVLDLFDLDTSEVARFGYEELEPKFAPVLAAAIENDLVIRVGRSRFQMTAKGYKYRDILSWMLFSPEVIELDREFYATLHTAKQRAAGTGPGNFITGLAVAGAS